MHTGSFQFKRPSMGAWTLYGLGSENENLPGFITISPPLNNGGPTNYGSSFLPAVYQGTPIGGPRNRPVASARVSNISNPKQSVAAQRMQLDFIQSLNRTDLKHDPHNAGVEGAIESFELAFRMQRELPNLMDLSGETRAVKSQYGIGEAATENFGQACLLARRCAEAGVRFVEVTHPAWDHHVDLHGTCPRTAWGWTSPSPVC